MLAPQARTREYISAHEIRFSPGGNFATDEVGRCPDCRTSPGLLRRRLRGRSLRARLGYGRPVAVTYWKSSFVTGPDPDVPMKTRAPDRNLDPARAGFV
jgi:hypothetical protein